MLGVELMHKHTAEPLVIMCLKKQFNIGVVIVMYDIKAVNLSK